VKTDALTKVPKGRELWDEEKKSGALGSKLSQLDMGCGQGQLEAGLVKLLRRQEEGEL